MPPRCVILHSTLALCNQRSLTSNKAAPVLTYTDVTTCTAMLKSLQHSPQSNLPFIQNCKKNPMPQNVSFKNVFVWVYLCLFEWLCLLILCIIHLSRMLTATSCQPPLLSSDSAGGCCLLQLYCLHWCG